MFGRWGGAQPVQVRGALYETVRLPENEWSQCSRCGGTGEYLESEDLHRSAGWVPCGCGDGIVRTKTVMTRKPVYRVPARTKKVSQNVS